ncbi:hypothetical protein DFQ30_009051 [Apophysomyces sp. BC1015]|nr:hypothetical protein DFQ30_009051 [Apophysomyces sp. BC1015]
MVLDCHRPGGEQVYVPLQHHIPWKSSQDGFYATWKNMPLHCMFCHQQGHNRNDCPLPPINKVVCYNCDEKGHIQSTCPRGLTRNKRLRGNGLTTSTIRTSTQNNKKTNTQRTTNSEDEKPNETQEKPELFQPIVYDPNDDPNESDYQEEDEFSENEEMIDEAKGEILPPGTAPRAQGTDHFVFFDPNNVQGSGLSPNGTIDNQQLPGSTPNDNSGTSASFPLNQ